MANLKTYDPSEVVLTVGGSIMNSWNTATAEYDEDSNIMSTGTSGEVTRTVNNNKTGKITITLPQTSADNATLSALQIANGVNPVSIIDKSGALVATIAEGVFLKPATATLGKETTDREWVLSGRLELAGGGNN